MNGPRLETVQLSGAVGIGLVSSREGVTCFWKPLF